MNESQLTAVDKHSDAITGCIEQNLQHALIDFAEDGAGHIEMRTLSVRNIQGIQQGTAYAQTVKLIRLLKQRDNGFKALLAALRHYDRENLARTLEEETSSNEDRSGAQTEHAILEKPWNAALRQNEFVGRESVLQQLEELQDSSIREINQISQSTKFIAACVGLGGVGKSSIALEFVYRNLEKYMYVIWVSATTRERVENCLAQLGEQLCIPVSNTRSVMWTDTLRWLQANPGWLIVFDDAQKYDIIQLYIPRTGGHVLVTSRYTAWLECKTIHITSFSEEETTKYLKRVLSWTTNDTDCTAFAEALGNLPLAIAQATAYMRVLGYTVQEYLTKFKTAQRQLLSSVIPPDCKFTPVYITWNVSLEQAKSQCSFAAELLEFCSLLDHDYVPDMLICEYAKLRDCSEVLDYAQTALFSYSLMTKQSGTSNSKRGMSAHPLVQVVTKSNLNDLEINTYVQRMCICLLRAWPQEPELQHDIVRDLYTSLEKCLAYIRPNAQEYEQNRLQVSVKIQYAIVRIAAYVYHILGYSIKQREELANALPIFEEYYGPNSMEVASTLGNLGNAFGGTGDYQQQKALLERALLIKEQHYGPDHDNVATTLTNLAGAYHDMGDYQKQKALLKRALSIKKTYYGPDHVDVAKIVVNLARAYGELGSYKKQKDLLERVLPIMEQHYGSEHIEVARTLNNLGIACGQMGNYQRQQDLLERALLIMQQHYGPNHVAVARTLADLSIAYGQMENYQKKKELLERAQLIMEHHYGPDHVKVAKILENLGNAYGQMMDYQKQKDLLERVLLIKKNHYGPDHVEVARTLGNLSNAYGQMENYRRQQDMLERALLIMEQNYGPDHVEVAKALRNLSNVYKQMGECEKQKDLLERVLLINEKHYGPDHVQVAIAVANLGKAYCCMGNYQRGKDLLERALLIMQQHYGPDHVEVAKTLDDLGTAYGNIGDCQKEKELLERALLSIEQHFGPDHVEVGRTLGNLGNAYGRMGNYQKQKDLLERVLSIMEQHFGPDHVEVAKTLWNLSSAYGGTGDYKKQKDQLERALPLYKKHYGPDHMLLVKVLLSLSNVYGTTGNCTGGEIFLEEAVLILEKHLNPDLAGSWINVYNTYKLVKQALPVLQKHYGSRLCKWHAE